jgi:hypothetical protein
MGVVYLADGPAGPVALKVVRRLLAGDPTFRARFRREVQAARRVGGRGVVELLDADTEGDRPYLAMAYVEGPTLLEEVTDRGPLHGDRLEALAVAMAEAVATIHRAGVTHRDLKPGNVLLTEDQPVVVDFGVAAATEATSITVVGTVMGSPGWMAPEQVSGAAVSPAMDVFTWGTLVAWAATGRNPFGEGRPEVVAYRIIHDEPDLTGVPDALVETVRAAMAKDPAGRPDAEQLLARLLHRTPRTEPEELAADATALLARTWVQTPVLPPVPPPPPPPPEHLPAPPPPHRGRVRRVVVAILVLLLCAAAGLAIGLSIREYQDRQDTRAEGSAGSPDEPAAATSTTTAPTVPITVRWIIADDGSRVVGEPCEAESPYDGSATVALENGEGEEIAAAVAVGEGIAESGGGLLDEPFGFTSCVYTVELEAMESANYIVRAGDEDPVAFTAAEVDDLGWTLEITTNIGIF